MRQVIAWINFNCRFASSPEAIMPNYAYNNETENIEDFHEFGEYYEKIFETIPLYKIDIPPPWSEEKLADNYKKIKTTGKMPPVRLVYDDFKKKYIVDDGIHRINAAKRLGYDSVPAIVHYRRTTLKD